jgi:hypothetical protein
MRRSLRSRAAGEPTDRHTVGVEALRRAVCESSGSTEPSVRAAAGSGAEVPPSVVEAPNHQWVRVAAGVLSMREPGGSLEIPRPSAIM